jgi:succinyl-CoA synthetase beta subunit
LTQAGFVGTVLIYTMYKKFPSDFGKARASLDAARRQGDVQLSEPDAKGLLGSVGIPTPRGGVAASVAEAAALCTQLKPPFAFKLVSPEVLHKTDIGGVELHVSAEQQAEAFEQMMKRVREAKPGIRMDGILIEEMQAGGVEMVASVTCDAQLGWMVMLGSGGIWVELLRDVNFRLLPIDRADVLEMLAELRGAALLDSVRGRPPLDREALIDAVLKLADLALAFGDDLLEVELNPLIVMPRGVSAVDAVIRLRHEH